MARSRKRKKRPIDESHGSEAVIDDGAVVEQAPDDENRDRSTSPNERQLADSSGVLAAEEEAEPRRPLNSSSVKEEISFYERSILALTKRNKKLLLNLSQTRSKQLALEQRRDELNERKTMVEAARTKHVALQRDLQDSLSRSQERLTRLTKLDNNLEEVEEVDDEDSDDREEGDNMQWDQADQEGYEDAETFEENDGRESPVEMHGEEQEIKPWSIPLDRIIQDEAVMANFGSRHRAENLMSFLPCIGIAPSNEQLMENLLTLMMQDASSLDVDEAQLRKMAGQSKDKMLSSRISRSNHRRQALWNTCLDLLQLVTGRRVGSSDSAEKNATSVSSGAKKSSVADNRDTRLDPNITLCPYELTGVCADEFCPYQHVLKESLVPRERLPLPLLRLSSLNPAKRRKKTSVKSTAGLRSKEEEQATVETGAVKDGHEELLGEDPASQKPSMDESEPEDLDSESQSLHGSAEVTEGLSTGQLGSFEEWNLDFVQLPPPIDEDGSDPSEDEGDEALTDEKDIVTTYLNEVVQTKRKSFRFWWDIAEDSSLRVDDVASASLLSWLHEVAGFQVKSSPENRQFEMLLEYTHAVPRSPLEYLKWFGRIVDASRVALHAGRFDFVRSLLQLAAKIEHTESWGSVLESEGIDFSPLAMIDSLSQLTDIAFNFDDQPRSCFHSAFTSQVVLGVVSEAIRLTYDRTRKVKQSGSGEAVEVVNWGTIMQLIEVIHHSQSLRSFAAENGVDSGILNNAASGLKLELRRTTQMNTPEITNETNEGKQQQQLPSLKYLMANVVWALSLFEPGGDSSLPSISVHCILDEVILPCWSLVRTFLLQAIGDSRRQFDCLRATSMMGCVILGSLEVFVRQVEKGNDSFDANPTLAAALSSVDRRIYSVLSEMYQLVDDVPMLELVLCPLFAVSISTATFLRHYAAAQHRLEFLLGIGRPHGRIGTQNDISQIKCRSFAIFSEFLWSQLLHLRFSLPTSSETQLAAEASRSSSKTRKRFEWDISKAQIEENRKIAICVGDLNIALHHVCLDGDWNLTNIMSKHVKLEPEMNDFEREKLKQSVSKLQQLILVGEEYLPQEEQYALNEIDLGNCAFADRHDVKNNRLPLLIPSRSTLPRSILLAGSRCHSLKLDGCNIQKLPAPFGLHFPNLVTLNLSGNKLRYLPKSFGQMARIQDLHLGNNQLESFPSIAGMKRLKRLIVADNCLEQLSRSLYRCVYLEELYVQNNYLWMKGEQEVGELTVAELTVRLPNLRSVTSQPQRRKTESES